jgi:hypothetical protein
LVVKAEQWFVFDATGTIGGFLELFHLTSELEPVMRAPAEEQIRDRAYILWEAAGRPADREEEFWYESLRQLNEETGEGTGNGSSANLDEKSQTFIE